MAGKKKNYVIDDQAVIAYLKGDSSASYLISIFKQAEEGKSEIFLPENCWGLLFLWAEQNNYNLRKINEILNKLPINVYGMNKEFASKSIELIEKYPELSVVDSIFITLAKEKSAVIVTGNRNLKFSDPEISISWV